MTSGNYLTSMSLSFLDRNEELDDFASILRLKALEKPSNIWDELAFFFWAFWKIFNKVPWELNLLRKKPGWFNYNRCFSAAPKVFINTVIWRGGPGPGSDYSLCFWEQ